MMPLVNVCIPSYNGAPFIRECIESVINQTYENIEILVVDDQSKDETASIVGEYARRDSRIRLSINEVNLGLVPNWNRCVELANGEWIKFVFQDDGLEPSCIARMVEASRPDVDLVAVARILLFEQDTPAYVKESYGNYLLEHNLTRHFRARSYISPQEFAKLVLQVPHGNCIGEPTATMVRRSAFERYGHFNGNLTSLCDWEYSARVAVNTGLCYVDEPLVFFRIHSRARSAEIRKEDFFLAATIDALIIQHELAYFWPYSLVRSLAEKENPPVRLKYKLAEGVRRAWHEAVAMNDGGKATAECRRAIMTYPRMLLFPFGYVTGLGLQKFRGHRGPAGRMPD